MKQNRRSKVQLRPTSSPRRTLGFAAHVLPLVVLAVGMCWFLGTRNADAQNPYPQTQYGNGFNNAQPINSFGGQPAAVPPDYRIAQQPGGNTATSSIPTIPPTGNAPAAEGPTAEGEGDAESESDSSWLKTPAFVRKIASGGWLMLPLAICSLIVLALSLERLVALRRGRVIPRPFVRRFTECVEDGVLSYEEATELCKEFDCPVSEVFRAALRRWGRPMFEIEQAVMDAGDRVSENLRKFLRVFHAISNVAPLIGLLGTVIGMIQAFEIISDQQTIGRPEALASGISTALMTTAGGLTVAIPAYLAYMYFSSKSDRYLGEIERLCQRVIDCISAEGLENASGRTKKRKAA
ncbi:MAG: MotA/TolQ/ExbB proton channel family protein [Planctomycetota bacterium]